MQEQVGHNRVLPEIPFAPEPIENVGSDRFNLPAEVSKLRSIRSADEILAVEEEHRSRARACSEPFSDLKKKRPIARAEFQDSFVAYWEEAGQGPGEESCVSHP